MTTPDTDDHPPASAADSLRLIAEERATAHRELAPDIRLLTWPWGIAWLVGFGLLFLRFGPDDRVFVSMPSWLPLTVLFGLLAAAGIISGTVSARAGRQMPGKSSVQGLLFGLSWPISFAAMFGIAGRLSDRLPSAEVGLMWAALSVLVTGVLYLGGGAIWTARSLYFMGVWLLAINVVGVILGPGWHSLIMSVGGGGSMLLGGLIGWRVVTRLAT
jgi:hypothetical protein